MLEEQVKKGYDFQRRRLGMDQVEEGEVPVSAFEKIRL